MLVSQPLLNDSSQLSKPLLQVGSHVPASLQLTEALAKLPHATPQAPQLFTVLRSVSHITLSPLQSALPSSHMIDVHLPPVQYGLSLGHVSPHAPQFAGAPRSVSQPSPPLGSSVSLLQSPQPASQAENLHSPVPHSVVAFGMRQTAPQPPQSVSTLSSRSQPLAGLPSQSSQPLSQLPIVHWPASHAGVACASSQRLEHEPQCSTSSSLDSQPSSARSLQSTWPGSQLATRQVPDTQTAVAACSLHSSPAPDSSIKLSQSSSWPLQLSGQLTGQNSDSAMYVHCGSDTEPSSSPPSAVPASLPASCITVASGIACVRDLTSVAS